ncbi:phosphomethylpyrimidine kinase, putative [Plasmodium gallinaceum]|uniref:Phosphomethylpyrimidine kinase, putative n=1 Tax=Plasmodium gallinaceum TaxID=5849 RepID=A0A1J1GKS2_PLAGA|nr:phosphomethylpyrimidine kinase, putative [Plasmodium gallinaceum]CRG92974.1 phosphomethylpyrimidine kinase, putative [Plasmodium gallinaceum]
MTEVTKILSIAGSDSCGGAGIQADIKTATSLGCHCCTVFVVLTAQNTKEIKSIIEIEENFIIDQLDSIFADTEINVIKLGVLYSKKIISLVHNYIKNINSKRENKLLVVFDPVFVSTSGCMLVENMEYIKFALDLICPISTIITPNFYECKLIMKALNYDVDFTNINSIELCKLVTEKLNINACLFKSCNISKNGTEENKLYAIDHLCIRKNKNEIENISNNENINIKEGKYIYDIYKLITKRTPDADIHGTGCTLSTAISCFLSKKYDLLQSCIESKKYIYNCIKYAYDFGSKSKGLNNLKASQNLKNFNDFEVIKIAQNLS